jgi:chromosome partitioning protein
MISGGHDMAVPHVLVLATGKGGVGKSSLARSLAGHWLYIGQRPAIIDADPQASIASFHDEEGPMGKVPVIADPELESVRGTISELVERHRPVIVDTAGFRNKTTIVACVAADLVLIPLKAAAEDVREAIAMFNLISELNATPERQSNPIRAAMVLTMTTPGTVIARHVRKELEAAGFPLLLAEVTQRVAYPELSMKGLAPSIADPEGAAARDIGRVAMELMNAGRMSHVQAA